MTETARTPTRGRILGWLALSLLPFVVVAIARWDELPSATDGDYAQYLLHAKAIAEGRPYSDIGYIYTDMNLVGPRNQPPGWPLVLAPFVALLGVHSPAIKFLMIVLVGGFAITAGAYFARRWGVLTGAAVGMAVPLALETGRATASALSDPLCCLLLWLALYLADHEERPGIGRAVGATGLAIFAMLVRVAGFAMIPALAAHAIVRKRSNPGRLVVALLGAGFTGLLVLGLIGDAVPLIGRFVSGPADFRISPIRWTQTYRSALSIGALFPFASDGANDAYHAVIGVPLVVGAVRFLRYEYRTALWWFVLAYGGLLMVSPVREVRYAWPLIPLVMFWIVTGMSFLLGRVRVPAVRVAVPRLLLLFIAAAGIGATVRLLRTPPRPALLDDPPTLELFDRVRSIAATADEAPRVVFSNPRVLTLETGVPAMGIPFGSLELMVREFEAREITHVIVPLHSFTLASERRLQEEVSNRSDRFVSLFRNSRYALYRLTSAGPPGAVQ